MFTVQVYQQNSLMRQFYNVLEGTIELEGGLVKFRKEKETIFWRLDDLSWFRVREQEATVEE